MNVLKPSKRAARELTGESDYERIANRLLNLGPELIALNLGPEGCLMATRERKSACPGLPCGRRGLSRSRRGLHGWPFLRLAAGLGSSAHSGFRECLFRALLYAYGLAWHVQARRGHGVHKVEECGGHARFCLISSSPDVASRETGCWIRSLPSRGAGRLFLCISLGRVQSSSAPAP